MLVTQDGFDGDIVNIYSEHDATHYIFNQQARSLAGFPRVKDNDCHLKGGLTPTDLWNQNCGNRRSQAVP